MKKALVVFTAAALSVTAVCSPKPAEARGGWGGVQSLAVYWQVP